MIPDSEYLLVVRSYAFERGRWINVKTVRFF